MLKNWRRFLGVDDTPVDGKTKRAVSSNWAYDHNAAKTGVHQAGGNNLATDADITTHNALVTAHAAEMFANLMKGGNLFFIPTTGWAAITPVGTGALTQNAAFIQADTGATADSMGGAYLTLNGFDDRVAGNQQQINWDKKLYLVFNISRQNSDAQVIARLQLKQVATEGALAALGCGIRFDNYTLVGESYGTSLASLDLATTVGSLQNIVILMVHDPSVPSIAWYVNGTLVGTQTTAAKMPTGNSAGNLRIVISIIRGATGTTDSRTRMSLPRIWQAI